MTKFSLNIKKVQILIIILFIGLPLVSIANTQVTLQWDLNDPAPEGYRLYVREEGQDFDYDNFWWQGDHSFNICTIDGLDESKTYYFVVHAFSGEEESGDSNEVRYADGVLESLSTDDSSTAGASDGGGSGGGSGGGCFIKSFF